LLRTDQIVRLLVYLAAVQGWPVAQKARLRVAQRKLKQLSEAGLVRRVPIPLLPGTGTAYTVYALAKAGYALVADSLGVPRRELGQPGGEAASLLFIEHVLSIQQVRITLAEACLAHGVELAAWIEERYLRKQPVRVALSGELGERLPVAVIPDAVLQLRLPSGKTLTACLELDRATTVVRPSQWQVRSMRRKYLAYRAVLAADPPPVWGTNFSVLTVATSASRAAHLQAICEEAGGDPHFWFATLATLSADTFLTAPVWQVAGRGAAGAALVPPQ
jgi:hypothetical protein